MSTRERKNSADPKRNVGMQTVTSSTDYIQPKMSFQHNLDTEEYAKIFAIPHNISALIITCGILYYLQYNSTGSIEQGVKNGMFAVVVAIVAFGALYLPDSTLRRPHPVLWRMVTALAICWLLFVVMLLLQPVENVRTYLSFFDKSLGVPLPEKSYAEACELTQKEYPYIKLDNFLDSIDFYMTAHLLGWYIKMLIIRDVKICWFLSIAFEILEITFRHWLPNFWECWWDHAILDVFGMNALGIWLGDLTCKYFEFKNYTWINKKTLDPNYNKNLPFYKKVLRVFKLITPNYWVKHEWDLFSSTKRFYQVVWFFIFMNFVDLSHFFFKYVLWIPQTHKILELRIYIWGLLAIVGAREYYEYITNPAAKRLGHNLWLSHLILFCEWAVTIKASEGMFVEPFPWYVVYFWTGVFLLLSGITIKLVVNDVLKWRKKGTVKDVDITEPEIEIEYLDSKQD